MPFSMELEGTRDFVRDVVADWHLHRPIINEVMAIQSTTSLPVHC
jgi:hypothetical protein